ncbi:31744_t:CDS:2, partial [Gigaspora margarita]
MHLKNLFSQLTLWHFAIFIIVFTSNQFFGSADLITRDSSLNRTNVPKKILATSMIGRTHLPQMCEILKILKDRGYDVTLISPGNYTAQSIHYRSIPQIIFENEFATNQLNSKSSDINKMLLDDDPFKMMPILRKLAVHSYTPFYNIYKQVAEENEVDLFFCDYMP